MYTKPSFNFYEVPDVTSPYKGDLPNALTSGTKVFVRLTPKDDCEQFAINFECNNGIAFHFNARPSTDCVVMNSCFNDNWGDELKEESMPFEKNKSHGIMIDVEESQFRVTIDGNHFFDFQHRVPFNEIKSIEVTGDIEVNGIIYSGGNSSNSDNSNELIHQDIGFGHHSGMPGGQSPGFGFKGPANLNSTYNKVENPPVPFSGGIPNGLGEGRKIFMFVKVKDDCDKFEVNFECDGGLLFHFNPRLEDCVVLNSKIGGEWNSETRIDSMPFKKGESYGIEFNVSEDCFTVVVNGNQLCEFMHRAPSTDATLLSIDGDIEITDLIFTVQ